MVFALAGRRIDALEASDVRFPLVNVDIVAQRLRELMTTSAPSAVVCSAACGADLLALKTAHDLGIRYRIVLPFDRVRFRTTSVVDRPGEWGTLFDALYNIAETRHDVVIIPQSVDDTMAYAVVNERIITEALGLAGELSSQEKAGFLAESVTAVIIWDGSSRGEGDLTAEFAARAQAIDIPLVVVDTLHAAN